MADAPKTKTMTKVKKGAKFLGAVALSYAGLKLGANFARKKGWAPAVTNYLP